MHVTFDFLIATAKGRIQVLFHQLQPGTIIEPFLLQIIKCSTQLDIHEEIVEIMPGADDEIIDIHNFARISHVVITLFRGRTGTIRIQAIPR